MVLKQINEVDISYIVLARKKFFMQKRLEVELFFDFNVKLSPVVHRNVTV